MKVQTDIELNSDNLQKFLSKQAMEKLERIPEKQIDYVINLFKENSENEIIDLDKLDNFIKYELDYYIKKRAFEQDFEDINPSFYSELQYGEICQHFINENPENLEYVNDFYIKPNDYHQICMQAINKGYGNLLEFINYGCLDSVQYCEICFKAVSCYSHDSADEGLNNALMYVDFEGLPDKYKNLDGKKQIYIDICNLAIETNPTNFEHVQTEYLTKEDYHTICQIALESGLDEENFLNLVDIDKLPKELQEETPETLISAIKNYDNSAKLGI